MSREAIVREDDNELLGFVQKQHSGWSAETIFGYVFARTETQVAAVRRVHEEGLETLKGVWQYYDKDDQAWYPCILKQVFERRVVVLRTNEMGYQEPDNYKQVIIEKPTDTDLVKVS